jgi:ABC-2 type transport system permease protein
MSVLSLALPPAQRRTAFGKVVHNEARLALRRPVGLLGALIPVVLLIIFGNLPAFQTAQAAFGGYSPFDLYVPILIVFSIAMLGLMGLPMPLASYRELGVLRRLSTTPVSPSWVLAAQGLVQLCITAASIIVVALLATTALHGPVPKSVVGVLLAIMLTVAAVFGLGLLIAALAPTAGAANVIGRVAFFPLIFFAGLWLPRALMPHGLLEISNYSPLGAAVNAIQASFLQGFPPVTPLLVLAGYAAVLGFAARRYFRWE